MSLPIREALKYSSPSELISTTLKQAKFIQKHLNAFTTFESEENLEKISKEADIRHDKGKLLSHLDGIPFGIKDNFCTKDLRTTCCSKILEPFIPKYDATVVSKTRHAGGIILGKTNMDEFGMGSGSIDSIFGPVKSLWRNGTVKYTLDEIPFFNDEKFVANTDAIGQDDFCISGGSSGGSVVAVSSGLVFASLGSDTGGSLRIPGAWSGVPTLKPSYGLLSRHGLIPLVNSLDVPGMFARSVSDISEYLRILQGVDPLDSTTVDLSNSTDTKECDIKKMTIGIPQEYYCEGMSEEIINVWSQVADFLENEGIKVVPVSLPHTKYSITCYQVLNPCEVASNMSRYDGIEYGLRTSELSSTEALFASVRHQGFNDVVKGRILAGNYFLLRENYDEYFEQALKVRRLISRDFLNVFNGNEKVDLLLTPVTLSDAPSYSKFSKSDNRTQTAKHDFCTQPINLAGIPAASIPVKLSEKSLPISLQIIGAYGQDFKVLSFCQWLEDRIHFPQPKIIYE